MLDFAWLWSVCLLPLPWLLRRVLPAARVRREAALQVPFYDDLSRFGGAPAGSVRKPKVWRYLAVLLWFLLVLAAMRPQWLGEPVQMPLSGRDLMLGLDISGSMREQDFQVQGRVVSRLDAVKLVAKEFIRRRQGDRVGLILFGDNAYIQTPLTYDLQTVQHFLDESVVGLIGMSTAIGESIGLAIKRLRQRPQEARVFVLLTDGANTAGAVLPREAARFAAEQGVRIYTIGVGAEQVVARGVFGNRVINPSMALDEPLLQEVAQVTGGRYFRARNTGEMEEIYRQIDELEPTATDERSQRPLAELYVWPLALALALSALLGWLRIKS